MQVAQLLPSAPVKAAKTTQLCQTEARVLCAGAPLSHPVPPAGRLNSHFPFPPEPLVSTTTTLADQTAGHHSQAHIFIRRTHTSPARPALPRINPPPSPKELPILRAQFSAGNAKASFAPAKVSVWPPVPTDCVPSGQTANNFPDITNTKQATYNKPHAKASNAHSLAKTLNSQPSTLN